jgi:hypothetical protein
VPARDHPVTTRRVCPPRAPCQLPGAPQPQVATPLPAPPLPYPSPPTQTQRSRDFTSRDIRAISLDSVRANRIARNIRTSSHCLTAGQPTPAFFISTKKILFLRGEGPGWPGGPLGNSKNRKVNLEGESGYTGRLRKPDGREEQMDSRDGQMDGTGGWTDWMGGWDEPDGRKPDGC